VSWRFLAYNEQGEKVWLKAVRSWHMPLTRITHSAASRLGLQGRPKWVYRVNLRKVPRKMEDYLVPMGVVSLEILELQTRLRVGRQRPEPRRPDVTIGLKDWERMRAFLYSGRKVPAAVENKRQEQVAKWHICMILRNAQKTCWN
jgi:hypothetical protein